MHPIARRCIAVLVSVGRAAHGAERFTSGIVVKMSGRSPAVCKIYSLARDSPGNVKCRVWQYKAGFRDVLGENGGRRSERGAHRGAIDLHYAKITPHAVNLVRRVSIRGISTTNVDMNTRGYPII